MFNEELQAETAVPRQPLVTTDDYHELLVSNTPMLDVRAPIEFRKGAFPASVNAPILNDRERELVGTEYKKNGQSRAIELGDQLLTARLREQRINTWLEFINTHPNAVLYCFRGGLRSRIAQLWLAEAGVEIPLVVGGYKALRTYLITQLQALCSTANIVLIGGRTGIGKTTLISQLDCSLDLEALACHRGSSFGALGENQPSNIDFENALTVSWLNLPQSASNTIVLEDEARLIGRVCVPDVLRQQMQVAPIAIVECDMAQRIEHCFADYVIDLLERYQQRLGHESGFTAFAEHHVNSLNKIRKRLGEQNYQKALQLLLETVNKHQQVNDTAGYYDFIELLLRDYYDPMYDYQLTKKQSRIVFQGRADDVLAWAKAQ